MLQKRCNCLHATQPQKLQGLPPAAAPARVTARSSLRSIARPKSHNFSCMVRLNSTFSGLMSLRRTTIQPIAHVEAEGQVTLGRAGQFLFPPAFLHSVTLLALNSYWQQAANPCRPSACKGLPAL